MRRQLQRSGQQNTIIRFRVWLVSPSLFTAVGCITLRAAPMTPIRIGIPSGPVYISCRASFASYCSTFDQGIIGCDAQSNQSKVHSCKSGHSCTNVLCCWLAAEAWPEHHKEQAVACMHHCRFGCIGSLSHKTLAHPCRCRSPMCMIFLDRCCSRIC